MRPGNRAHSFYVHKIPGVSILYIDKDFPEGYNHARLSERKRCFVRNIRRSSMMAMHMCRMCMMMRALKTAPSLSAV